MALGPSGPLGAPSGISLRAFVTPWDALLDIFRGSDNRERHTVKIVHGAHGKSYGYRPTGRFLLVASAKGNEPYHISALHPHAVGKFILKLS